MAGAVYYREQAAMCRRYAGLVLDEKLRLRLIELAVHFETAADRVDTRRRPARTRKRRSNAESGDKVS